MDIVMIVGLFVTIGFLYFDRKMIMRLEEEERLERIRENRKRDVDVRVG